MCSGMQHDLRASVRQNTILLLPDSRRPWARAAAAFRLMMSSYLTLPLPEARPAPGRVTLAATQRGFRTAALTSTHRRPGGPGADVSTSYTCHLKHLVTTTREQTTMLTVG
jgi:hypothetical protein